MMRLMPPLGAALSTVLTPMPLRQKNRRETSDLRIGIAVALVSRQQLEFLGGQNAKQTFGQCRSEARHGQCAHGNVASCPRAGLGCCAVFVLLLEGRFRHEQY